MTAAGSGTCPLAGTVVVSVTPVRVDRDSRARKIAASLSRAGAQSVLAGGEPGGADSAGAGFREISLRARERPARPVGTGGRGSAALRSLRRALDDFLLRPARRLPRADVYYLHAFYQFPGVLVRSLLHHAPIVYDAHDFYPALVVHAQAPRWQDRMERRIEAACIRRAAAVVTVSDGVAELYEREFGVRPLVVRNCHDQRLDRPVTRTVREAAGAGPDDFVVVIVGNRKHELPFATIVAAAGRVGPGVIVALVGDGYTAEDRLAVARAECGDRLALLPAVHPSQIVPFMATADAAGVLYRPATPTVANCLPNGLFQSLSAGLPLVYAGDLPMVQAVAEGAGIPVDADDPASIAGAIDRLAGDAELRDRCRGVSRERAVELAWEREEAVLLDVVRTCAGPSHLMYGIA